MHVHSVATDLSRPRVVVRVFFHRDCAFWLMCLVPLHRLCAAKSKIPCKPTHSDLGFIVMSRFATGRTTTLPQCVCVSVCVCVCVCVWHWLKIYQYAMMDDVMACLMFVLRARVRGSVEK